MHYQIAVVILVTMLTFLFVVVRTWLLWLDPKQDAAATMGTMEPHIYAAIVTFYQSQRWEHAVAAKPTANRLIFVVRAS